jgi:hypothetical protein
VRRDAIDIEVIWVRREAEYFCKRGWTAQISLIRLNKFDFTRKRLRRHNHHRPCESRDPHAAAVILKGAVRRLLRNR